MRTDFNCFLINILNLSICHEKKSKLFLRNIINYINRKEKSKSLTQLFIIWLNLYAKKQNSGALKTLHEM